MCGSLVEADLRKIFMYLSITYLLHIYANPLRPAPAPPPTYLVRTYDILHKATSAIRPTLKMGPATVLPHHGRDGLSQYGPSRAQTELQKSCPNGMDSCPDRTMENTASGLLVPTVCWR